MELKRKYFICWIDDSNNVDPVVKGLHKNLTEYWFLELDWQVNPQPYPYPPPSSYEKSFKLFGTYVEALEFLKTKSVDHAIIIKVGHDLETEDDSFIQELDQDIIDNDVFIGDQELYYLNVKQWKSKGCPLLSKIKERREFSSQIKKTLTYIADQYDVYNFIKDSTFSNFLPWNTEPILPKENSPSIHSHHFIKDVSVFYTVACGLNHLKILKDTGYTKDLKLVFFDSNEYSLYMMKQIHENWNGLNYKDFISSVDVLDGASEIKDGEFEKYTDYFGGMQSWLSWFNEFKDNVNLYYDHVDLLDSRFSIHDFISKHDEDENSGTKLMWLSNIFQYRPTAVYMGLYYRCTKQIELLNKLNDIDNFYVRRGGIPVNQVGHWLEKDKFLIKEFL